MLYLKVCPLVYVQYLRYNQIRDWPGKGTRDWLSRIGYVWPCNCDCFAQRDFSCWVVFHFVETLWLSKLIEFVDLFLVLSLCLQNNYIQTSKYTLLSFVPVNLIEQFQRLANFYFLCLLVLQFIPTISSLTPVTTAVPLIGVLALTAIKDAYDDFVIFN